MMMCSSQEFNYQASEEQKRLVISILEAVIPGYSVWVFGSRVEGGSIKPYSDLDLAVLPSGSSGDLSIEVLAELREAFDESDLPWKVDVVNYEGVSDSFKAIIKSNCIQIVGKKIPSIL